MDFKIHVQTKYNCSLERAFKAPILGDVRKVHTGFGLMPAVTKTTNDENWGQIGAIKNIYAAKSLTFKGGEVSTDKILERIENKYWKLEVVVSEEHYGDYWNPKEIKGEISVYYSQEKKTSKKYNAFMAINNQWYRSENIIPKAFLYNFKTYREKNKIWDLNKIIFYLNNAELTYSIGDLERGNF